MPLDEAVTTADNSDDHVSQHNALHAAYNALEASWLMNLFLNPDTPHTDDQEFTGTIGGTAVTPSGTVTWTQDQSLLSVEYTNITADDYCARLYSLTPNSTPVTIETSFRVSGFLESWNVIGLGFTDGVTGGSNAAFGVAQINASNQIYLRGRHGTLTNMSSATSDDYYWMPSQRLWVRLIWSAPNTFDYFVSPDGVSWFSQSTISKTMTPTHFGVAVGSIEGKSETQYASFDYVRVYESDLSA